MNRLMRDLSFSRMLQISRPRFWIYVAGTYALGCLLAFISNGFPLSRLEPHIFGYFLYFLLPANLLIYGVNDIFDYETDRLNAKKVEYEALVSPGEHRVLLEWIALLTAPFLIVLTGAPVNAVLAFFAFLLFAVFYSAEPVRAKTTPFVDCLVSSSIYLSSGVFGFYLAGGTAADPVVLVAGLAWASAMHAYSAVPDIEADLRSGTPTVATYLGRQRTLLFCAALYGLSAALTFEWLGVAGLVLGVVYVGLMALSLAARTDETLFRFYRLFPALNTFAGMVIFLWLIIQAA